MIFTGSKRLGAIEEMLLNKAPPALSLPPLKSQWVMALLAMVQESGRGHVQIPSRSKPNGVPVADLSGPKASDLRALSTSGLAWPLSAPLGRFGHRVC